MLLTTDCALESSVPGAHEKPPRCFIVVSKPCQHPECALQPGFIRGSYESVEVIREVRTEVKADPLRKVRSSVDLPTDEANAIVRDTMNQLAHEMPIRPAHQPTLNGVPETDTATAGIVASEQLRQRSPMDVEDDYETKIEWLMVTRSDPGGSVPRFMVEKGTPGGIAGDADKFLKWVESKSMTDFIELDNIDMEPVEPESEAPNTRGNVEATRPPTTTKPTVKIIDECNREKRTIYEEEEPPTFIGFYGMVANAIGAAATMLPLPNPFGLAQGDTSPERSFSTGDGDDDCGNGCGDDDRSSIHTFHSFATGHENLDDEPRDADVQLSRVTTNGEEQSLHSSTDSTATRSFNAPSQHEKELRKLEERKRKMEDRLQRAQSKALAKRNNQNHEGATNDEDIVAKLREKHEREVAKQTEKYQRELRKLEAKRHSEQRKAEERRRKQAEREEKANLTMELEKVRAERDVARKQIEVLKEQIGELQGQNTMLVAKLGREGITLDGGIIGTSSNSKSSDPKRRSSPAPGKLSRTSTGLGTPSQSSLLAITALPKAAGDRPKERGGTHHPQAESVA